LPISIKSQSVGQDLDETGRLRIRSKVKKLPVTRFDQKLTAETLHPRIPDGRRWPFDRNFSPDSSSSPISAKPDPAPDSACRAPHQDLTGEILDSNAMLAHLPAWEDLCARSAEDNVYYSPRYARALLDHVERDQVEFAVVWKRSKIVALLPFTRSKPTIPLLWPSRSAWKTKYNFNSVPLLDRELATEAAEALLELLESVSGGEWIFPDANMQGVVAQSLLEAMARKSVPSIIASAYSRAVLETGPTYEDHIRLNISKKRRKSLTRNRRRLEELGEVEFESHTSKDELKHAVDVFLEMELGGWKGQRGTALACNDGTRKFAAEAFSGEEVHSCGRADVLKVNDTPIAVSLAVLSGRTGFTVKCCYDESYSSYSPGLLLEVEVIRSFLSEKWADRLDSATIEGHVIEDLWPGRIEVADIVFSLAPRNQRLRCAVLKRSIDARNYLRTSLKKLLRRGGS